MDAPTVQIREYLDGLFHFPEAALSAEESRVATEDIVKFIVNRLFSRQFRRTKVHPDTQKDIEDKVKKSVESNKPIYLVICFGGYKHYWNPSYPNVDFAELFNFHFMAEWVAPILKVYKPGVNIDYEFENIVVPMVDNYPKRDIDIYADSFKALIAEYMTRAKPPQNFRINAFIPQELEEYRQKDYENRLFKRMEELMPKRAEEWAGISDDERKNRLHRTPKAFMWKGDKDLSGLSEKEKEDIMIRSKELIEAYYEADFELRGDYFVGGNHIPVLLSFGLSAENVGHWLTITAAKGSNVDFWVGRGIVEASEGRIVPRIVSHNQYDALKQKIKTTEGFKWVAEGSLLKNLKSIDVVATEDFNRLVISHS
jgi:hypothetical protein